MTDWLRIEQLGAETIHEVETLDGHLTNQHLRRRRLVRHVVRDLIDARLIRPAADGGLLKVAEELELGLPEHETGWRRLLAREVFG